MKLASELARVVAEEEDFMNVAEGDAFNVEAEKRQCARLVGLMEGLHAARSPAQDEVVELSSLLGEYFERLEEGAWRLQRMDLLQQASDALGRLLAADSDRGLAGEVARGSKLPELDGAVVALASVLRFKGQSCGGGGGGGGGCSLSSAASQGGGSCCGGGGKDAASSEERGGCCGGGGCDGGGCKSEEADAGGSEVLDLKAMVAQCKTPEQRTALCEWIVDEEVKRIGAGGSPIPAARRQQIWDAVEAAVEAAVAEQRRAPLQD